MQKWFVTMLFRHFLLLFFLLLNASTISATWLEDFNNEPIDFTDNQYFSVSNGRLYFYGDPDPSVTGYAGVTWNGGANPGGDFPLPDDSNYFDNVIVSVDTFWEDREDSWSYGIFVNSAEDVDGRDNVALSINKKGSYVISKKEDDVQNNVVSWTKSSLLSVDGQNNNLSIKKVGPYFYFYINQVEVERRLLEGFQGGGVGVYSSHPVDVSFDNFAVFRATFVDFEDDENIVFENFNSGPGGFSENEYYTVSNNQFVFLGNRTDFTNFTAWDGGFSPGGWSAEPDDSNYFANFTASVDTYWKGGTDNYSYGLTVCTQKNSLETRDSVKFYIISGGWYLIGKNQNDVWQTLVNWTQSPYISTEGLKNKISVQKDGSQFRFSINDKEVESLTIEGFLGGGVGVMASQHVDVNFDDFSITQPGIPPTADAGTAQSVKEGDIVDLNGSGSTDDTAITSYQWYQLHGPPVTISDPSAVNRTFIAPDVPVPAVTLAFQLKVTDGDRLHDSDITLVEVGCMDVMGDVDGDCNVNLKDAIVPLQVVTGTNPTAVRSEYLSSGVDVSGDNKVGTEEAVNALRKEAGL